MLKFSDHSGIHSIKAFQKLPISKEEAWQFLSDPRNLNKIVPPEMDFRITSETEGDEIFPGQIITYTVKPVPGFRSNWVTEITQVDPERYFIDEQRHGPYAMWHHEHWVKEIPGGTAMFDHVSYKLPLGILGNWLEPLVARKRLRLIFEYRFQKLEEIFGPFKDPS
ncbi:hypothetical protein FUAX_09150 [Fulvitalea axinellae]|uniref:Coenzyme Q-binding protein COQ10 START domain-containing protein n=1 Tax=Fulvitalea axinellae TaxID=1182444 RepID=A0AAU9CXW3_9BACT|nr:hypothetical protein FUAX_09150 [Fulvitalea axinellae]